jgi:quinol monooxygenase YgiN
MTDHEISWHVELVIEPENMAAFSALTVEMCEATLREDGVLVYERFISDDCLRVELYERYRDSAAALSHVHAFKRDFGARFSALVRRRRFTVFGPASEALKRELDPLGAVYLKPLHGFSRLSS